MRLVKPLAFLFVVPLFFSTLHAEEFTLADLQAMVEELETVVPRNPNYEYPIELSIPENEDINAAAGFRIADGKLQTILEVNTGFIAAVKGDVRLIRAVVGHELAHLALGHAIENANFSDLDQHLTRQEEHAADAASGEYLEELGYARQDVVDLLLFLDGTQPKDYPIWLAVVASDHASPVTRAALISGDDKVLAALSRFEVGLAFMECRRHQEAILWFEAALAIEERMHEARINIALAAVQDYYERLPLNVQEEWLRPEFIAHLTSTILVGGRTVKITDKDLARYQRALERIAEIPEGTYVDATTFLRGTLQVLNPHGNEDSIKGGVELLRGLLLGDPSDVPFARKLDHLRAANNIAVGLQRLGQTAQAQQELVRQSMRVAEVFLAGAAENVGRMPHEGLSEDEKLQALNATVNYIMRTPPDAPNFAPVQASMKALLQNLGRSLVNEIEPPPLFLCSAIQVVVDGHTLSLFDNVDAYLSTLGDPSDAGFILEKYPDLGCVLWGDDLFLLMERGEVMKITSYRPDSSIELKPKNTDLRETYTIKVGMSEADLDALLDPTGNTAGTRNATIFGRMLLGAEAETWRFYPTLNLGVLLRDGVVVGISVTSIKG